MRRGPMGRRTRPREKLTDVKEYIECLDSRSTVARRSKKVWLRRRQFIVWQRTHNGCAKQKAKAMWDLAKLNKKVYREMGLPTELDDVRSVSRRRQLENRIGVCAADEKRFRKKLKVAKPEHGQHLLKACRASLSELADSSCDLDSDSGAEKKGDLATKSAARSGTSRRASPPPSGAEKRRRS